ncbi:MAG: response regulator [Isosphaeraceae bacterium]
MPKLDGIGLLRELRSDPNTRTIPVIMLSARAGEDARIDGLAAGVDDYVTKPFPPATSSRVVSQLELASVRRVAASALQESEERYRALVRASSEAVYRMSPDWTVMRHLEGREFIADTVEPSGDWLRKYIHPDDQPRVMAAVHEAIRTKSAFEAERHRVWRVDGAVGWMFSGQCRSSTPAGESSSGSAWPTTSPSVSTPSSSATRKPSPPSTACTGTHPSRSPSSTPTCNSSH